MPKVTCKDRKQKRAFTIEWSKGFTDTTVSMDHTVIGRIHSLEEFESGQTFILPDQSQIVVKMLGRWPMGEMQIYSGEKKLVAKSFIGKVLSFAEDIFS